MDIEETLKRQDIGVEIVCGITRLFWNGDEWIVKRRREIIYRGEVFAFALQAFNEQFTSETTI